MKQANFDVSHELDEFLMVEKHLTHTKRKANADLDKLKPEMRQLEEQYVAGHYRSHFLLKWRQIHCLRLHATKSHVVLSAQPNRHQARYRINRPHRCLANRNSCTNVDPR